MYLLLLPVIALYSASSLFYKQNKKNSILTLFGVGFWATFFLFIAFLINFGITKHPFANFTWKVYGWIVLKATLVVV
ncbi:MAG: hypothetical protein LBG88_01885, partial [Christensenellaceae bacterium]|nr:hypothetical protein [Christensenellaceae bacterium]